MERLAHDRPDLSVTARVLSWLLKGRPPAEWVPQSHGVVGAWVTNFRQCWVNPCRYVFFGEAWCGLWGGCPALANLSIARAQASQCIVSSEGRTGQ